MQLNIDHWPEMAIWEVSVRNVSAMNPALGAWSRSEKSNLFRGKTKEVGGSLQGFMPKAGNRSGNKLGTATSNNVILLDGLAF